MVSGMTTPRGLMAVTTTNKEIYLVGGTNFTNSLASVEVYDIKKDSWKTLPNLVNAR